MSADLWNRSLRFSPDDDGSSGGDGDEQSGGSGGVSEPQDGDKTPETVPYSRFKEVNDRLATMSEQFSKLKAKVAEGEEEEAKARGEFEKLHAQEKERADQAEAQLLRMRVGAEVGLPPELIRRLQGSSEEELRQDAEQLRSLIPADGKRTPEGDPRRKVSEPLDVEKMSAEDIRKNKDKLIAAAREAS